MRISDWSSDVCSSDLSSVRRFPERARSAAKCLCLRGGFSSPSRSLQGPPILGRVEMQGLPENGSVENGDATDIGPGRIDRKSVVQGKSVSGRVVLAGRPIVNKKINTNLNKL